VIHDADWMLWFAIALAGVCVLPFLRDWRIRLPLATFFLLGFLADQIVLAFSGQHLTTELAAIAIREHALAGGFLRTFGEIVGSKSLLVACVALAFLLPPDRIWDLPSRNCLIPLGALLFVAIFVMKSEGKMDAFPSPYSVPAVVARDRGGGYASAAAKALPSAIQVADRWHLYGERQSRLS
jgi:hypothetical protein